MIKMIVKQLSLPIKKLHKYLFFKKRFKEVSHFLEQGSYYCNLRGSVIVNGDCSEVPLDATVKFRIIHKMFSKKKGHLFLERVGNRSKPAQRFKGTHILFSNKLKNEIQYGELKIFNLNEEKVLSTFNTHASFDKKLSNTIFFSDYFLIPKILESNEKKLFLVEELIDFHKPSPNELIALANYIIKSYQSYFSNYSKEVRSLTTEGVLKYASIEGTNHDTLNLIASHVDFETLPQDLPSIYQHGDLSLSNILIDDSDRIYFIDFEHSGYFSMLYDVMWFWQNEAINNNDYSTIEHYFKGGFDDALKKLFIVCNLTYHKNQRLSYLLFMILEVVQKRVIYETPELPNNFLSSKVKQAVNRIIQLSKINYNE